MFYKITEIEGVGPEFVKKFEKVGITTTEQLLKLARDPRERTQLAARADINETLLTKWTSMADLMRLKGVGKQYSELLVTVGVDSVNKLHDVKPEDLLRKMEEVNKVKNLARALPKVTDVEEWKREVRAPEFATQH